MPELAEVRLTSDFINQHKELTFVSLSKSPESKIETNLYLAGYKFKINSKSRGKELLLEILPILPMYKKRNLRITLGMSGEWVYYNPNIEDIKHVHLYLTADNGFRLGMRDVRRFARWTWNDFNPDRGEDPLSNYSDFSNTVISNYNTHKDFKKPICEVLMNQRWFNGIGNYLRAEILYRLNINPFMPAKDISLSDMKELLSMWHQCVSEAYLLGGGQLKDWKNPNGEDPTTFNEWMKCYGKMESHIDKQGRNFWYDPKWKIN